MYVWKCNEYRVRISLLFQHRCGSSCETCHSWPEDYGWVLRSNENTVISLEDEENSIPYNTVEASITLFLKCLQKHINNKVKMMAFIIYSCLGIMVHTCNPRSQGKRVVSSRPARLHNTNLPPPPEKPPKSKQQQNKTEKQSKTIILEMFLGAGRGHSWFWDN